METTVSGAARIPNGNWLPNMIPRKDVEKVLQKGYIILQDVFSTTNAAEGKAEFDRLHAAALEPGRNPFEGLRTNRVYALLNKFAAQCFS